MFVGKPVGAELGPLVGIGVGIDVGSSLGALVGEPTCPHTRSELAVGATSSMLPFRHSVKDAQSPTDVRLAGTCTYSPRPQLVAAC